MNETVKWLLEGEPFVRYRTQIDLIGQSENEPEVIQARKEMITEPKVQAIVEELKSWPGTVLSSHKSASQSFHKLSFIADLGFNKNDPDINNIVQRILERTSQEGPFQLPTNIPKHFGGSGENEWAWSLCDAPTIIYSLAKLGYEKEKSVQKAAKYLIRFSRENGWPCTVSKELGKFRGPGKKDDPCPYATLIMLKMLRPFEELKDSKEAYAGTECLLSLWKKSLERHPYQFYMGTNFRKIKAPFIWYDILHVLEVLTQFNWVLDDDRFKEMLTTVLSKADVEGKYKPESEWKAWSSWDFGQKKRPSQWLTFLILRIQKRSMT